MHTDKINAQKRQIFNGTVTRVRRRGDKIHSQILDVGILEKWGDKEFLSFISRKIE